MRAGKGEIFISQNVGPPFANRNLKYPITTKQRLEFDFFCIEELQKIFCFGTEYKIKMYVIQKSKIL